MAKGNTNKGSKGSIPPIRGPDGKFYQFPEQLHEYLDVCVNASSFSKEKNRNLELITKLKARKHYLKLLQDELETFRIALNDASKIYKRLEKQQITINYPNHLNDYFKIEAKNHLLNNGALVGIGKHSIQVLHVAEEMRIFSSPFKLVSAAELAQTNNILKENRYSSEKSESEKLIISQIGPIPLSNNSFDPATASGVASQSTIPLNSTMSLGEFVEKINNMSSITAYTVLPFRSSIHEHRLLITGKQGGIHAKPLVDENGYCSPALTELAVIFPTLFNITLINNICANHQSQILLDGLPMRTQGTTFNYIDGVTINVYKETQGLHTFTIAQNDNTAIISPVFQTFCRYNNIIVRLQEYFATKGTNQPLQNLLQQLEKNTKSIVKPTASFTKEAFIFQLYPQFTITDSFNITIKYSQLLDLGYFDKKAESRAYKDCSLLDLANTQVALALTRLKNDIAKHITQLFGNFQANTMLIEQKYGATSSTDQHNDKAFTDLYIGGVDMLTRDERSLQPKTTFFIRIRPEKPILFSNKSILMTNDMLHKALAPEVMSINNVQIIVNSSDSLLKIVGLINDNPAKYYLRVALHELAAANQTLHDTNPTNGSRYYLEMHYQQRAILNEPFLPTITDSQFRNIFKSSETFNICEIEKYQQNLAMSFFDISKMLEIGIQINDYQTTTTGAKSSKAQVLWYSPSATSLLSSNPFALVNIVSKKLCLDSQKSPLRENEDQNNVLFNQQHTITMASNFCFALNIASLIDAHCASHHNISSADNNNIIVNFNITNGLFKIYYDLSTAISDRKTAAEIAEIEKKILKIEEENKKLDTSNKKLHQELLGKFTSVQLEFDHHDVYNELLYDVIFHEGEL